MDEPRKGHQTILRRLLLAIVMGSAIDLTLAAAYGYPLARPLWSFPPPLSDSLTVVGLEMVLLTPVVTLAFLMIQAASHLPGVGPVLRRAPRFMTLGAAMFPVILNRLYRAPGSVEPLVVLALLGVLSILLLLELFGSRRGPSNREGWSAAVLSGLLLPLAVWLPSMGGPPLHLDDGTHGSSSKDGPSLLIIVLDTLRADHLGLYGYPRSTSPWLDDFARTSIVFDRAIAPSSYTLPSHASLFTGLYPEAHGALVSGTGVSLSHLGLADDWASVQPLSQEALTLAEIAREAGLQTGAVCANVAYLSPYFALDQGFQTYVVPGGGWYSWQPAGLVLGRKLFGNLTPASWDWWYQSRILASGRYYLMASEVNDLALRWLGSRRDSRFFLFLNYMDAHAPYMPVNGYRDLFPAADVAQIVDRERIESGERRILPEERQPLIDAYDAEIRYLDDHLAALFEQLETWGLLENMIVVIAGDHGESFGEHNEFEHATGLHESQLHVPLLLRLPGQVDGRRESRHVYLADVMPTLIEALGLEIPTNLQVTSLFETTRPLPIVAHLGPYAHDHSEDAIYSDPWKLILSSLGDIELYDTRTDPDELMELSAEHPDIVQELVEQLRQFKTEVTPRFGQSADSIDPETLERLKALGYIK
jgi:arylsulfatase A-like enzyme